MRRGTLTLQARYIYPVEGPPIEHGSLTIHQGRIAWIGPAGERPGDVDLGNVGIMPGFVNAHTHLELEPLSGAGLFDGRIEDEVSWLRHVVEQRRVGTEESARAAVMQHVRAALDA